MPYDVVSYPSPNISYTPTPSISLRRKLEKYLRIKPTRTPMRNKELSRHVLLSINRKLDHILLPRLAE
jgi:hypothetical protein